MRRETRQMSLAEALVDGGKAGGGKGGARLDRIAEALDWSELDAIMGRRGLRWHGREIHSAPALFCEPLLRDVVAAGIARAQPDGGEAPIVFSRAGHDGMALGAITGVGMLFLRNPDGISHHPDEAVSAGDVAHGIRALFEAVTLLGHEPRG